MEDTSYKKRLIAGLLAGVVITTGGGIILGRTMFAPSEPATATAEAKEEHGPEGAIELDDARIKAAGIVTEAVSSGGLGAEIIAQAVVAATPEGEAVLTARADGAVVRRRLRQGGKHQGSKGGR